MATLQRLLLVASLFLISTAANCEEDVELTGTPCEDNSDCDDGIFCNGEEFCAGNVCASLPEPNCDDGIDCTIDTCSEVARRCDSKAPDLDEDGFFDQNCRGNDGVPLGRDCDDGDGNIFPGNTEVCDQEHKDEDCDPTTFGSDDADQDGLVSVGCCNQSEDGLRCGTDCDDSLTAVVHGSQICGTDPSLPEAVQICRPDGSWEMNICPDNGICFPQANGTGVCIFDF